MRIACAARRNEHDRSHVTNDRDPILRGTAAAPARSPAPPTDGVSSYVGRMDPDSVYADDPFRRQCLELALRCKGGDMDAFQQLIEATQGRVQRVLKSVIVCDRDILEDMLQEVFLRVWKALPRFEGDNLIAWIHTVATNVAITELRQRKAQKRAQKTVSIDAPMAGTEDLKLDPASREREPSDLSGQHEFASRVRTAVLELPEEFRLPVVLRDLEGMSYDEVAEALSLPGGTVRSRIHRGRCMLQVMLQGFLP